MVIYNELYPVIKGMLLAVSMAGSIFCLQSHHNTVIFATKRTVGASIKLVEFTANL